MKGIDKMIVVDENRPELREGKNALKVVSHAPRYPRLPYQIVKRVFDILASLIALVLLFPVFLIISILIGITEGFPVVFKQQRVGKGGKLFYIYKFRTMVKNADEVLRRDPVLWEEFHKTYKLENDPRISKVGSFLRKSTLDELPQLFNVLGGSMSVVGPRPIVEPELEKYGDFQDLYLAMKPGCAGLWQCSGRSNTSYDERVALDSDYYQRAGLRCDLWVIFKTLGAVFMGKGAQ